MQTLLFVVFFSVGIATLALTILCEDLHRYYHNKAILKSTQKQLEQLKSLNEDYDILLSKLQDDPNLVRRLGPATLGIEPQQEDTIYPKAKAEQLAAAKKALTRGVEESEKPEIPGWLVHCSEPGRKTGLLVASGALIIISFACFNRCKREKTES